MTERTHSKEAGFSLIESMIALAIFAVVILGLLQLFGLGVQQNSLARINTMGLSVAQKKIEELQAEFNAELESGTPASDLTAGAHGPVTVTLLSPSGSGTADRSFQVSWNVAVNGTEKTITLSASPITNTQFESKTISLTAVFAP